MSYSKQTWVNGEVITAAKLNHMEDGIESSGGGGSSFYDISSAYTTVGSWEYIDGQAIRDMFDALPEKIKFLDNYLYISWVDESTTPTTQCTYTSGMSEMFFSVGGQVRIRFYGDDWDEDLGAEVLIVSEEKYYAYDNDTDKYVYDPMGN